jgi:hypothetical protein
VWTLDDSDGDGPDPHIAWSHARSLRELRHLGVIANRPALWIAGLPILRHIESLGLTVIEPAGQWLPRIAPLTNIKTLEIRPRWNAIEGVAIPDFTLQITRGDDGELSQLGVFAKNRPSREMMASELASLPSRLTVVEADFADPDTEERVLRRFARPPAHIKQVSR